MRQHDLSSPRRPVPGRYRFRGARDTPLGIRTPNEVRDELHEDEGHAMAVQIDVDGRDKPGHDE